MSGKSYRKFIKYATLNEISKFTNLNNIFLLSKVSSVSVWFSVDLSREKSKLLYLSKGLVGAFLIYIVTNKYPSIRSSKDQRMLYIESHLVSQDLGSFLEKFLLISNLKQRKNIAKNLQLKKNLIRFLITDLNLFNELEGFMSFFLLIDWLYIDIHCNHEEDFRNFILIDNLLKSSYLM